MDLENLLGSGLVSSLNDGVTTEGHGRLGVALGDLRDHPYRGAGIDHRRSRRGEPLTERRHHLLLGFRARLHLYTMIRHEELRHAVSSLAMRHAHPNRDRNREERA
jgi:hypothetical protein